MRFEIHSKTGCPFCTRAKTLLDQLGYPYEETLHDDDVERQQLYDDLGLVAPYRTVPQIIEIDARGGRLYVGGYSALLAKGYPQNSDVGMFDADF